jgi:tetratricopeptide (TPR) repeat protein
MFRQRRIYKTIAILVMFVTLFTSTYGLQRRIDFRGTKSFTETLLSTLPSGDYLKSATLGFEALIADFIWVHTVVTFGERIINRQNYEGLYHTLDIVTTLDPRFHDAYNFGSLLLSMQLGQVDESIMLLERAIENYPDDWRFPFIMGFNYTFFKKDDAKALVYFVQASKLPGHPPYMPRLIGNLYGNIGKIDIALIFLEEAYQQFEDPKMKADIAVKLNNLLIERDILILEAVARKYKSTYGAFPDKIESLTQSGLISLMPEEPYGGQYVIDSQTGEVVSEKFLFRTDSKFLSDLSDDNNQITPRLQQAFSDNQTPLSENTTVMKTQGEWLITDPDNEQIYAVKQQEKGSLNIYRIRRKSP